VKNLSWFLKFYGMYFAVLCKYFISVRHKHSAKFVILSQGRSGSTALISLLDSLPGIHSDGEILRRWVPDPLVHIYRRASIRKSDCYGFKIITHHIQNVQNIPDASVFLRRLHFLGYKIIYLKRDNLLELAVSNIKARQDGFHAKVDGAGAKSKLISVALNDLMYWLNGSESVLAEEKEILADIPHLELVYERDLQFSSCHPKTVKLICNYINVDYQEPSCEFRKISAKPMSRQIENYEEVKNTLAGTKFERFL
jgi:hypothetical protein